MLFDLQRTASGVSFLPSDQPGAAWRDGPGEIIDAHRVAASRQLCRTSCFAKGGRGVSFPATGNLVNIVENFVVYKMKERFGVIYQ